MPRNFDWRSLNVRSRQHGARFWLQLAAGALGLANLVMLVLYFAPPGGSRQELTAESQSLQTQIRAARMQKVRVETVAGKVQLGQGQATDFEARYILPQRLAFESVIAEIQRMARAASLLERDAVYTTEPIEGTADLSVLNTTVNFEGTYSSLMRFLYEADKSRLLLMLDTLQASPQKAGQITASVRFQAIIREEPAIATGGRP